MNSIANENCEYCQGTGERHNGYFKYLCNCVRAGSIIIRDDLSPELIDKLKNTTILELAQQLEDVLIISKKLPQNMSTYEFIKNYLNE